MKKRFLTLSIGAFALAGVNAQVTLTEGTYLQNFNTLGSGLPSGWTVRTGAASSSLGTAETFTTSTNTWGDTGGGFKNLASADGLTSDSTTTTQNNSTNRALGIRQTADFGDPGASFNFYFSTTDLNITQIKFDLQMLSVQGRSTTWSVQYGIGATPASFSSIATWPDSGVWGSTTFTLGSSDFGTALNDQANVHLRFVALTASTGSNNRDTMAIDNFSVTAIPEPSSALLFGLGAGLVLLCRRHRK